MVEMVAAAVLAAAGCAGPDRPVSVLRAAPPDTPPIAQQQRIFGTVKIVVDIAADGSVRAARVGRSPSVILNQAALRAARSSTYRPAVHDCVPVAATYLFGVHFPDPSIESAIRRTPRGETEAVVHKTVTVLRNPDHVAVEAYLLTFGPTEDEARAANDAAFAQIASDVDGIATIRTLADPATGHTSSLGTPSPGTPSPPPRVTMWRIFALRVGRFDDVPTVVKALEARDAQANLVYWSLTDPSTAQREALAEATRDARAEADKLARARGLRVAAVRSVQPARSLPPYATSFPSQGVRVPPQVPVEATVTATYLLTP